MHDAIATAQGKPGSFLRTIYIGTLAPSTSGWWHDLINGGSDRTTYVQALKGDPEKWDQWAEIKRRCKPIGGYLRFIPGQAVRRTGPGAA